MLFSSKKQKYRLPSIVMQQDEKDCGIACLLSLIQYYEGDSDFENLRRLSGTTLTGTTLLGLYQAANESGFDAKGCEADMKALLAHPSPCILHVLLENRLQHYVVYFGSTLKEGKQHLIIGDPAKGIIYLTPEQLDAIWQSKVCLILSKNNSFLIKKDIVNVKKIWFKELIKMDSSLLLVAAIIGIVLATLSLTMSIFSQRLIDDFIPKKQYNKVYLGILG
jgi:ATP-binding cassette subfamily B protein